MQPFNDLMTWAAITFECVVVAWTGPATGIGRISEVGDQREPRLEMLEEGANTAEPPTCSRR